MGQTKDELQLVVNELGPWHYCWYLPHGVLTGTSVPNLLPDKMAYMIQAGAFSRSTYPKVLDLGANSGYIARWFVENRQSQVTAVEGSEQFFRQLEFIVNTLSFGSSVVPVRADITKRAAPNNEFDLVLLLGVLHHLPEASWNFVLTNCLLALKQGGECVVQTKTEIDVKALMESAGFVNVKKLCDMGHYNRTAWFGMRDPMKLPPDPKEEVLRRLFQGSVVDFQLEVLTALGEIALALHWLRGTFWWLQHTDTIRFSTPDDKRSFMRLYNLGGEYEEKLWRLAPPRAVLVGLQEFLKSGEFTEELKLLCSVEYDGHGRLAYGEQPNLEDIEDILRRVMEAKRANKRT